MNLKKTKNLVNSLSNVVCWWKEYISNLKEGAFRLKENWKHFSENISNLSSKITKSYKSINKSNFDNLNLKEKISNKVWLPSLSTYLPNFRNSDIKFWKWISSNDNYIIPKNIDESSHNFSQNSIYVWNKSKDKITGYEYIAWVI